MSRVCGSSKSDIFQTEVYVLLHVLLIKLITEQSLQSMFGTVG